MSNMSRLKIWGKQNQIDQWWNITKECDIQTLELVHSKPCKFSMSQHGPNTLSHFDENANYVLWKQWCEW